MRVSQCPHCLFARLTLANKSGFCFCDTVDRPPAVEPPAMFYDDRPIRPATSEIPLTRRRDSQRLSHLDLSVSLF
jgi:hypothetical protein